MRRRWLIRLFCVLLCVCTLSGCGGVSDKAAASANKPLVVSCTAFGSNFSPFFATAESDRTVMELTQLQLLYTDRAGRVICNGIDGEVAEYNGTPYTYFGPADVAETTHADGSVEYRFTLRDDLVFSDGTPLTARDVIFTMYVLCDPTYIGTSSLSSLPIKGLEAYQRNVTPKWQLILEETPSNVMNGSAEGFYTASEAIEFWTIFNETGAEFIEAVVADGIEHGLGTDVCSVAAALGYTELPETATATDLFNAVVDLYGYDVSSVGIRSLAVENDFTNLLTAKLSDSLKKGVITGNSAPRISGIRQTGDHTFSVTLTEADVTALHQFCFMIAPLHYYGDVKKFSPESGNFGFNKGDLAELRENYRKPLGAGAYVFSESRNGSVFLKANESFYRGTPHIAQIECRPVKETEKLEAVLGGKAHLTKVEMTPSQVMSVEKANGGVLSGDAVTVESIWEAGYGYIGISAERVCLGGNAAPEASVRLREALMTIFAAHRSAAVEAYYGEYGSVLINPSQPDEMAVFGDGSDVGHEAAVAKALECLSLAGYTVADGRITAAPIGAPLSFEIGFVGSGVGDHSAALLLKEAKADLERIGITLTLLDYEDDKSLIKDIRSGKLELWCDFRRAVPCADYYAYYASDGSYRADLDVYDGELDRLLLAARKSVTETERERLHAEITERIAAWAVELPLYQKQSLAIFDTKVLKRDSLAQDTTPFYDWKREIETLQWNG